MSTPVVPGAPCPLILALRKLGSRWALVVLRELLNGPTRFNNLQRNLPQIPAKSRARVLENLEKEGLVRRKVDSTRPPRVSYSILHNDPILREVIDALFRWGKANSSRRERST